MYSKTIQVILVPPSAYFLKSILLALQHIAKKKWNHFLHSRIHCISEVWVWDPIKLRQATSERILVLAWLTPSAPKSRHGPQRPLLPPRPQPPVLPHHELTHLLAMCSHCHSWFPRWLPESFRMLHCPQVKIREARSLKNNWKAQIRLAFQRQWSLFRFMILKWEGVLSGSAGLEKKHSTFTLRNNKYHLLFL